MSIQDKIKTLEADLRNLKVLVGSEEKTGIKDVLYQKGVIVEVWDDGKEKERGPKVLDIFEEIGDDPDYPFATTNAGHYTHARPIAGQWINIPDELMEAPNVKGVIVINLNNGSYNRGNVGSYNWEFDPEDSGRVKRICILDEQDELEAT